MDLIHLEQPYRNIPYEGKSLRSVPLAAAMGGEIPDVQLSELDDQAFSELREAIVHHKMVFLRNQMLSPAEQERFTLRFGEFGTDAYTTGLDDHPDVQPVIKEAATRSAMIFGGGWHTDSPFLERPPSFSILHGVDIPPYGGDTTWYNAVLAYESLSDEMKDMLARRRVHMSAEKVIDSMRRAAEETRQFTKITDMELKMDIDKMLEGSIHPLLRRHPESGEVALYCDDVYAVNIDGMTRYESRHLLNFLVQHIAQEDFSCRLRWASGTVAIWDNRSCLHRAFNDYDGFRREMYRTTVKGEVPIPAFT